MAAAALTARGEILLSGNAAQLECLGNILPDRILHFLHLLLRIDEIAGDWVIDQRVAIFLEFGDLLLGQGQTHLLLVME